MGSKRQEADGSKPPRLFTDAPHELCSIIFYGSLRKTDPQSSDCYGGPLPPMVSPSAPKSYPKTPCWGNPESTASECAVESWCSRTCASPRSHRKGRWNLRPLCRTRVEEWRVSLRRDGSMFAKRWCSTLWLTESAGSGTDLTHNRKSRWYTPVQGQHQQADCSYFGISHATVGSHGARGTKATSCHPEKMIRCLLPAMPTPPSWRLEHFLFRSCRSAARHRPSYGKPSFTRREFVNPFPLLTLWRI